MKKVFVYVVSWFLMLTFHASASAAERGTMDEAVALVKSGIAFVKANGKEKAIAEFNSSGTKFKNRDLYVFMIDMNGTLLASAGNQRMVGKDLSAIKDVTGNAFVKKALETAKANGKGWTDYMWPHPVSNAIEEKSTYMEVNGDIAIGCGAYKSK